MMEFKIKQHRLSQLSSRLNLMVAIVAALLISNILMASLVCYTTLHQRIEVTPFFGQSHYVKSDAVVDTQYLSLMSENFMYSRLNITPETVLMNYKRLLSFVDSRHYATFSALLLKEASLIIKKKMSSHFAITDVHVDSQHLSCRIKGILKRSVGSRDLPQESLQYTLKYRYHLGHLTVIQFTKEVLHETR